MTRLYISPCPLSVGWEPHTMHSGDKEEGGIKGGALHGEKMKSGELF